MALIVQKYGGTSVGSPERIEAVTGEGALAYVAALEERLDKVAGLVRGARDDADSRVGQLVERSRKLEKELEALKAKLASSQGSDLAGQAIDIEGIKVLAARLDGADNKALREAVDQLKNKLGRAAVVLASVNGGKVSLVAGVTRGETGRIQAGALVNQVAGQVGGRGGGRPDMAQAGGSKPDKLDAALASVPDWVRERLATSGDTA